MPACVWLIDSKHCNLDRQQLLDGEEGATMTDRAQIVEKRRGRP